MQSYTKNRVKLWEQIQFNPILPGLLKSSLDLAGGGFRPPPNSLVFNCGSIKLGR